MKKYLMPLTIVALCLYCALLQIQIFRQRSLLRSADYMESRISDLEAAVTDLNYEILMRARLSAVDSLESEVEAIKKAITPSPLSRTRFR